MSSLEVMAVAIHGTGSPFSLSMNGVPKTCVENSLLPPPSRHGAIVLRIRPGDVTVLRVVQVHPRHNPPRQRPDGSPASAVAHGVRGDGNGGLGGLRR